MGGDDIASQSEINRQRALVARLIRAMASHLMSSHDSDPPAVAQPSEPPPPVSLAPVFLSSPPPRAKRYVGPALIALAGVAIGGYALVASRSDAHSAAAHSVEKAGTNRPADLFSRIDGMLLELPRESDLACAGIEGSLPVVTYAPAAARLEKQTALAGEGSLLSEATPLAEINARLPNATRVALVRSIELTEPHASVGTPTPGRYEGQLVVVDTNTGAPLCHTRVVTWSSSLVEENGISLKMLRDDFTSRVHAAIAEAGARLHVEIEL